MRASLLQGNACLLWEPRPRGDGSWSAGLYSGEDTAPAKKRLCKHHQTGSIIFKLEFTSLNLQALSEIHRAFKASQAVSQA